MEKYSLPTICFVGVGNMGNPMAANLLKSHYPLKVYDLDKSKASNLIEAGASWVTDLPQAISQADVIITSLPGPSQVEQVMFGDANILKYIKKAATLIDTSTSSVELASRIQEISFAREFNYLEAPLTNAVDGAIRGELAFFIGGEKKCFQENQHIFNTLGCDIFYVGKPGNGNITKLITNLLWFINAAAIGEGLMIGAQADIPLEIIAKALKSSAGNSWVVEHDIPALFEGHYDPSFSLGLCCKDLGLVTDIADSQGIELPMGKMAQKIFESAREKYGAEAPELSVVRIIEEQMDRLLRPSESNDWQENVQIDLLDSPSQAELMKESHLHMPQGVAENYRYWGDDKTIFVKQSKGCTIIDSDNNAYVDFRLGYGPIILGYGDERVDQNVINQIKQGGILSGFATELDARVAKQIKNICPNIEKMRFANSGTEAVMGAVRTARGFTKRDRIVIVEGGFHGLYDEMMWKSSVENWDPAKSKRPDVVAFGDGIPDKTRELVDFLPLNNFEELESLFKIKGLEIACVLLEPIIGNCGAIESTQQWLASLKKTCEAHGSLLIMDEVKTGFRVAKGGAQELYGIHGDLTTYAKAMGNGYPVAAFGGRADVMNVIGSHENGVVHGGTYTANLIGLSAAQATLDILTNTDALKTIDQIGKDIIQILTRVFTKAGIEHQFSGPASMFGIHFTKEVPTNYRDWRMANNSLYEKFAWYLIDNGVMLEPDSREPWFICEAHQAIDLGWLEDVAGKSMANALNS
jgi:glutamate-1-semialdehyde 2,1-aminomutase